MTPLEYYQRAIFQKKIRADARQLPVIEKLTEIAIALEKKNKKTGWWRKKKPVTGLYLWGKVGIGKTYLMDCFYHTVTAPKLREHFHAFMQQVHQSLHTV